MAKIKRSRLMQVLFAGVVGVLMSGILMSTSVFGNDENDKSIVAGSGCVILLHGLARTSRSFLPMEVALRKQGYVVINVDYPSREHTIAYLAEAYVAPAVEQCGELDQKMPVHFVTHSMGGILARHYLKQVRLKALGRVVMLSPPNQGSEVVDKLGEMPGFYALNGPAGQQLGTDKTSMPNQLGAVSYPVGVITGDKSINFILSMMIPGDDDGKVSIARAKLEGMADFLVVPHTHPMIMRSEAVIRQTLLFIKTGAFDHAPE